MFFSSTFLLVSLMNLWIHPSVTVSAQQCPDKPVFTPPSLVVRYGQAASAACSVCRKDCPATGFGLEKPVGTTKENGTNIFWEVDSLTEWDTSLICYYNTANGFQCATNLVITLYQPPDSVTISFGHGDGPLLAGQSYTLECAVQRVAPVKNLKVTFYKGRELLAQRNSTRGEKKPVDEIFTFSFNASEEDDGAIYRCYAQLDLKVQQIPLTVSQSLLATVHYKPRLISASSPGTITVIQGYPLELNCSAVGKPNPLYMWTRLDNARFFSNTSVYSIEYVSFDDEGLYSCTVSNSMGTVTVNFNVEVKGNYVGWIIGAVIVLVLIIIGGFVLYNIYYNHNYIGRYDLITQTCCCRKHTPVATSP